MPDEPQGFKLVGPIRSVETIARGRGVRIRDFLQEKHRGQSWRKMKGIGRIEDEMAGSETRKSTGSKRTASAAWSGKSYLRTRQYPLFAICIDSRGYEASLRLGKVYRIVRPQAGDLDHDVRVIDEEGEDYLYPAKRFEPVQLPPKAKRAVRSAVPSG